MNTQQDAASELASIYSVPEIVYIKRIVSGPLPPHISKRRRHSHALHTQIELIFTAANSTYCISSKAALQEARYVEPSMSSRAAQELLNNLLLHGWLRQTKGGRYTLATRALLELKPYLEDNFPEHTKKCQECDDLVMIVSPAPRLSPR